MLDLHLDASVPDAELLAALAQALGVPGQAVRMLANTDDREDLHGVDFLCQRERSAGEFPLHLHVYFQPAALPQISELEVARRIVRALGCRCLVSDDAVNPYSWVLVDASGERAVTVDPGALDRGELTLRTTRFPERPDMQRLVRCFEAIIGRVGAHGLSEQALVSKLEEILFSRKQAWESAREGILTEEETANLLLAHVDTLVEKTCGRRFHSPENAAADTAAVRCALFGDSDDAQERQR